jgi:multiple sugar transport system permease protein
LYLDGAHGGHATTEDKHRQRCCQLETRAFCKASVSACRPAARASRNTRSPTCLKASCKDLVRPLIFLRDVDLTLPRGLLAIVQSASITGEGHFELLMAAAVITTLPMVVLFFLGQRYFVEGIATTGTKG